MLKYRPEIDGLRAIAVLSVVFYHAGFNLFKGGYVGVDVFFVISGFLITSIILKEVEHKIFSILSFYERRARRILPALFFVMLICIPLAWLILEAKDLERFFKSLSAIPTLSANIFFWKDVVYFATASELKPLIHTWSLAVEEQYYVISPVLFLPLGRMKNGKSIVLVVLVCLAIFSLLYAQVLSEKNASKNFFLLPSRFWELSLGGFVAFLPPCFFDIRNFYKRCLGGIGLSMVLFSVFSFSKDTQVPGFVALIPTLGTALILMYSSRDTIVGKLLSWKPFVSVGLISYSAYLWHQPVFAFNRYYIGQNDLGIVLTFFLIFLVLLLAWLSWRFVELPFKNKMRIKRAFVFKFGIVSSLFFIVFGHGFSKVFQDYGSDEKTAGLLVNHSAAYFNGIRNEAIFMESLINAQLTSPEIVVIGSSRIMQVRSPDQRKLLNLGVSGSTLRDAIGMAYLVDKKLKPSVILVAADPWLFSSQVIYGKYKTLENAYFRNLGRPQADSSADSKSSGIKYSIQRFYDYTTFSMQIPRNDLPEIKSKKRSDGSHVYDSVYISKSQIDIEAGFDDILKGKVLGNRSGNTHFMKLKSAEDEFVKFIKEQRQKRKVVLVLSPYHPKLYERIIKELPVFIEIEKNFKKVAEENSIQIIGSYDPRAVGCIEDEFYNGTHPKDLCMKKIIANINY